MRFDAILLSEGIEHVEDLKVDEFIAALRNFDDYEISEKVDGSNIQFGIDEKGFYTTREDFGGKRVYDLNSYPVNYATTFQRSAHAALEKVLPQMEGAGLSEGDRVEAEVLFGALPNAVPYSSETNQIILLRTVDGDASINRLKKAIDGDTVVVDLPAPYTLDGKTTRIAPEQHKWTFAATPTYSGGTLATPELKSKVNAELDKLETYLKQPSGVADFSNAEILALPLNKRPDGVAQGDWADLKAQVKAAKEEVQQHVYADNEGNTSGFKARIKEILLNNMVRQIKSAFGPEIADGGWIEGVVFRHKKTGQQFKIVDKSIFSSVKDFLWQVRNDMSAKPQSLNKIESFIGKFLAGLASSVGHPELGTTQAKRYVKKFGSDRDEIVTNLAKDVNFEQVKQYWVSFINQQEQKLTQELQQYQNKRGEKEVTVDMGNRKQTFKYDDEVDKRTLQVFSSLFSLLEKFKKGANSANSAEDLIMLLAGDKL